MAFYHQLCVCAHLPQCGDLYFIFGWLPLRSVKLQEFNSEEEEVGEMTA